MYRAVAWWMLQHDVNIYDVHEVAAHADGPTLVSGTDPRRPTITLDGVDVSVEIRSDAVNAAVSPVSAVPAVRARLVEQQRDIIGGGGIVVEGRDIGAVVAPFAQVKVYLTADPAARAQRRAAEEGGTDVDTTQQSLLARDAIDSSRDASPLTMAEGAVHIDTTGYTLDEVIDQVVALVEAVEARA
jgi:cytidylate kinase